MPWTVDDVEKHNKGLSDHQKKIWVEVANSVLSKTGDDGSAITQANGVVKKTGMEAVLYSKAADMIEAIRLQEAANFWGEIKIVLNESDPKPRVEKDINGKPIVPTADQYRQYFEGMAASHIEAMMKTAQHRWKTAAEAAEKTKSAHAKAEVRAIATEVSVGRAVLKGKQGAEKKVQSKLSKKQKARYKAIHTSIKQIAGKNPFLHMIAKHVADHYIGHVPVAAKKRG